MRILRSLMVVLAVSMTAACGIQASGVISGVQAPRVDLSPVRLFFVANRKLIAEERPTDHTLSLLETLALLAGGPAEPGLTTEVPADIGPSAESGTEITVSADVSKLSTVARSQIGCTLGPVVLTGQGQRVGPLECRLG
ncbi:hypothetical protein [Actinocrispum sp. NPDC049592]|uniref:hypothetical protein n=1 Tax=Actinocrispum sp. NPDC049592 TaxID=3154835 RepID=UPI003433BE97